MGLVEVVDEAIAGSGFTGVVQIERGGQPVVERAVGLAHRSLEVPMAMSTRCAMASGSKGFTAVVVLSLAAEGTLPLTTPARELLGADLPLVDDAVTVEHLLAQRSGIGDFLDEDEAGEIDEYALAVPVHTLGDTEGYLAVLDGHPQAFPPGGRFAYCNGGFVLLALLAERASGTPFPDLVAERVTGPAGMVDTAYDRADDVPAGTAVGYLHAPGVDDRTNVLHLPLRGTGDGGAATTATDMSRFWAATTDGTIDVGDAWAPVSDLPEDRARYGLGFWLLPAGPGAWLEGYDAGVSFRSTFDPATDTVATVLGTWPDAAWPVCRAIEAELSWR